MAKTSDKTYDEKATSTIMRLMKAEKDGNFDEVFDLIFGPEPKEEDADKPDR